MRSTASLDVGNRPPPGRLVRLLVGRMERGESVPMPRVVGDAVVKNAATVIAARFLNRVEVEVEEQRVSAGGPAMGRPVYLTADQRPVVEALADRVREIVRDPEMKNGRALELAAAYLLAGDFGWPGEPVSGALAREVGL